MNCTTVTALLNIHRVIQFTHVIRLQLFTKITYTLLYTKTIYTGWPNKNRTFLRYHIFEATTEIIMQFLRKCSEMTAENNNRQFFKRVLNILCKVTENGLRHTRLLTTVR